MIGLFCFDGPLYKDKNGAYCSITITNEMLNRYLNVCDELYLLIRTFYSEKTNEELNMPALNIEHLHVVEMPNYYELSRFLWKKSEYKRIDQYVQLADMVFARMPSQTSNMVLKRVTRMKKPYMAEVGGCAWDSFVNHGIKGMIMAPYMFFQEKKYVKQANYSSYVTKQFLQKRYPTKAVSSINCSNVYINPDEDAINKRKSHMEEKCDVILGTAANSIDVKYKGQDSVIQAIGILKKKGLYVRYHVVGPGTGDYLKSVAKECDVSELIEYVGVKTKSEMIDWLDSIDIYLQPSKQEGLPRALIEAMSRLCYCLGSDIAGIPELLSSEYRFKPGDYVAIANCIEKYISLDSEKVFFISENNYKVSKEYSSSILNSRREQFFLDFQNYVNKN